MSSHINERIIEWIFKLNGIMVIVVLGGIFALLFVTALPFFQEVGFSKFFLSTDWNPTSYNGAAYGVLAMLVSTWMVTLGALCLAIPIGIGSAAYLADIAKPGFREIAKPVIEILAGIPSVVLGFFGLMVVSPMLAKLFGIPNGLNALNGSILLAVMALPTIISLAEDALKAVPATYEEASLALGANKWETLIKVKIPAAKSGIMAACLLGMGRAIGETMTVLMATGCAPAMPHSLLDPICTMSATIAIELGEVAYNTTHYYALFGVGLLLFMITFAINLIAELVIHKHQRLSR